MFERHFGLRENPFVAGHQHRFVYPSPEHLEALAHLRYGIENREPFVLITGEVGTGKTTALYDSLSEWESRVVVALITNSALTRAELLEEIALRFGVAVSPGASKPQIMTALERHLNAVRARQHRAILLLDEAQNLDRELLEEIRLLSNLEIDGEKMLQVVLVGQPELEEKLARPELRQLRQRITVHYRLRPLSAEDTARYIQHRVTVAGGHALSVFPVEACFAIHRLTSGIPREINHLAAQAMLAAYVEDSPCVRVQHVETSANEIEFKSVHAEAHPAAAVVAPQPPMAATAPIAPPPPPVPNAPVVSEGAPRTASTAGWSEWMSALASNVEAKADESERRETVPTADAPHAPEMPPAPAPVAPPMPAPPPAPIAPAVVTARAEAHVAPPAPYVPPALVEPLQEPDFAARLAEAAREHAPASAPRAPELTAPVYELPARLREKMEAAEAGESRSPLPMILGIAAVVIVAAGAVLWYRFNQLTATPKAAPAVVAAPVAAAPAPAPAPVDSAARDTSAVATAARDSVAASAAVASVATPAPVSVPTPKAAPTRVEPPPVRSASASANATMAPMASTVAPIGSGMRPVTTSVSASASPGPTVSTMPATPALPPMRYGVAVRTLIMRDRADEERVRLSAAAGMVARVFTVHEAGGEAFRVVLGEWTDRLAAERSASDLIRRGLVDEARVVPIGRAPAKAE